MSSFTITRHEPEEDSNISQHIHSHSQKNSLPLEQHVHKEGYNTNTPIYKEKYFWSLENAPVLDDCWDFPINYNHSENNSQDMDSFLRYHGLLDCESNNLPEKNITNLHKNTNGLGCTNSLSTSVNCPPTDSLNNHFQPVFSSKDNVFPLRGKLTWQQSILSERKQKQDKPTFSQTQCIPSTQESIFTTSPASSRSPSLVTDEELNRQTKGRYMIKNKGTPFVATSTSEPLLNSIDHQPLPSSSEPQNTTGYTQYSNTDTSADTVIESPLSNGGSNDRHQTELANYMALNDTLDVYSDSCYSYPNSLQNRQVMLAMPRRQKQRYDGDYYTPKWVRYTGHLKEGYCDSCHPGKWLQLKNSAYWYHKQFYHGVSSVTGKPFMKPLHQRLGKGSLTEGLCHQCQRFVPVCNSKKKNNYMLWYRHAHKCHLHDKNKIGLNTENNRSSASPTSTIH